MFQFFMNPWLLISLAGIGLPIVAHLLSRRRYDVVEWAAMQFLNPSKKTRRRLKLEELLLLLLRIGLITLIVLSVTRPWLPGGWLTGYYSAGSRTVVVVIDGSNSMSRTDGANSMHQHAIRRASEFLRTLGADDSVALIDARDQPRSVIESPLRDLTMVEQEIRRLPPPGGACGMLAAMEKAIAILGRSSASAREVVVFSDRQGNSWKSDNEAEWLRFDDLIKFPSVRPHVWVVDVAPHLGPVTRNVSVGRIELSRELTVSDFPVRLRVAIRNESSTEAQVPLRLLLDGQPLAGKMQSPSIPAHGESVIEFDHALRAEGAHVLSVEAEMSGDVIAVDNLSHAAIYVARSLDVLLVNGTPAAQPADRDSFFAELAFAPPEGKPPWVKTRLVEAANLTPADFHTVSAAIFCNVGTISPEVAMALREFVAAGNGLMIACGPNSTPESFQACFVDSGLLPQLQIVRTREAPPQAEQIIRVAPLSLQPGWLDRFRSDPARSFLKATFDSWCLTKIGPAAMQAAAGDNVADPGPKTKQPALNSKAIAGGVTPVVTSAPLVLAALSTSDPLLLESRCGDGFVLIMTTTLDRTWNDLPTRSDFVPFLHEAVFHAASSRSHRNVDFGEPLIARLRRTIISEEQHGPASPDAGEQPAAEAGDEFVTFIAPGGLTTEVRVASENSRSVEKQTGPLDASAVFTNTFAPGVYAMAKEADAAFPEQVDAFVVNYDHSEDELTQLTADDKARLVTNDRIRFSSSLEDLAKRMYGAESIAELWAVLLTLFLLFLVAELLLTRRAIRKGYGNDAVAGSS
ncbi:MAG: VWA domain-containing protein [Fuerstia sp.]|nr:VWA domain-containing protein [Fuerstiella sp.]